MNYIDKTSQSSYKPKNMNKDASSSKYTLSVLNWKKYTGSLDKGIENQKLKFKIANDAPNKTKVTPKFQVPRTVKTPFMSQDEIEKDIKERTGFQDSNIDSQGLRKGMKKAQNLIKQSLKKYQSEYFTTYEKQIVDQIKHFGGSNYLYKEGVTNSRMNMINPHTSGQHYLAESDGTRPATNQLSLKNFN